MNTVPMELNPFALLLDADAVIARVTASKCLAMLNSRVCRPLDKPLLGTDQQDVDAEDAIARPVHTSTTETSLSERI